MELQTTDYTLIIWTIICAFLLVGLIILSIYLIIKFSKLLRRLDKTLSDIDNRLKDRN